MRFITLFLSQRNLLLEEVHCVKITQTAELLPSLSSGGKKKQQQT